MKTPTIYLDTSVVSHLDAPDVPEKMSDTLALWEQIKQGDFSAIVSDITIAEIEKCDEPKKSLLYDHLSQVSLIRVDETGESLVLAQKYIQHGALKEKSRDDCRHIGLATTEDADYIVSWNFKHFVNVKVIDRVQAINKLYGYKEVKIISPPMLGGNDDE